MPVAAQQAEGGVTRVVKSGRFLPLLVAGIALGLAAPAGAATFTVDSTADDIDGTRDGICATATGACTLRAAILEANETDEADSIGFAATPFNGTQASAEITLTGNLPEITKPLTIDGGNCGSAEIPKPCVGLTSRKTIDDTSAASVGIDARSSDFALRGLAIYDIYSLAAVRSCGTVTCPNSPILTGNVVQGNWFGFKLSGERVVSIGTQLYVGDLVEGTLVGGESAATRNVFGGTGGVGGSALQIIGDSTRVTGNYFGVKPDGTSADVTYRAKLIELGLEVFLGEGAPSVDNTVIGGPEAADGVAGVCDGACNLFAGGEAGVWANGARPVATTNTSIVGNQFGLLSNGKRVADALGTGVNLAGSAASATVGGPATADRNYFAGYGASIANSLSATGGGGGLIQNNYFGLNASGTAAIGGGGISLKGPYQVKDNRFGATSRTRGPAITMEFNVTATGNVIGVGTTGADLGYNDDSIVGSRGVGFLGSRVEGNVIANGAEDAIEVRGGVTQVLANSGSGNQGVMLDLTGPEGPGSDGGIQPPTLASAVVGAPPLEAATLSGSAGEPIAFPQRPVIAYRLTPGGFEVVGRAEIRGSDFNITAPGVVAGDCVAVTVGEEGQGTSELSEVLAVGGEGSCDLTPPATTIDPGVPHPGPDTTLTVRKGGGGSGKVTSAPAGIECGTTCKHDFPNSTMVTLTATASGRATVGDWEGCDRVNDDKQCVVKMDEDLEVTANFYSPPPPPDYTLTVTKTGTGTVTSAPAGINCGANCSASFVDRTTVVLSATATGQFTTTWTGCDSVSANTCTLRLRSDRTVSAKLTALTSSQYPLTVTKAGTGSGTVTSAPAGISCGATCSAAYAYNTTVTLTAAAASGSTFTSWTGCATVSGATCTVRTTAAKNVTATFTATLRTLTVTKAGAGSGTVTSSPAGIDCGASCSAAFANGTLVVLSATVSGEDPDPTWTGCDAVTPQNECELTLSADKAVTATFPSGGEAAAAAFGAQRARTVVGPVFTFSAERGAHFECRLDDELWRKCSGRRSDALRGVSFGRHLFRVRAIDSKGNVDPTPATRAFVKRRNDVDVDGVRNGDDHCRRAFSERKNGCPR